MEPGESGAGIRLGDELGDLGLLVPLPAAFPPGSVSFGATPSGMAGFRHKPPGNGEGGIILLFL